MRESKAISALASLTILGTSALIFFSVSELPPSVDRNAPEAVGWALAQEVLNRVKPGGQIIVITRDTTAFKQPAADAQLAAFKKVLHAAQTTINSIQALQLDPLRPVEVPPGDFFELIRKSPPGSVIVSFMGPPLLSREQRERLSQIQPQILAFCSGNLPDQIDLRALFEQGLLHLAVVSRRAQPLSHAQPRDLRGWFDRSYMTVTAANVATLYASAGARD